MQFRKKDGTPGTKDALKVAQSGTPVPAKDFSTKGKIGKASGATDKKGSLTIASTLPTESGKSTPEAGESKELKAPKKSWEGSPEDFSSDYREAKRRGISPEKYDDSAADRIADAAGQKRFDADESDKVQHAPEYKKGVSAFSNPPKSSHGFGHPTSARDGHLRNSGDSRAHRIGAKKK